MKVHKSVLATLVVAFGATIPASAQVKTQNRDSQADKILKVREAVWRAWFTNDSKTLAELVPEGTIVISAGEEKWKTRTEVLQSSADFHASGGKLIRLDFPRTEIQRYGHVAIIYSQYLVETEVGGKPSVSSGRVSEVFVMRNGRWTNPGWHTEATK